MIQWIALAALSPAAGAPAELPPPTAAAESLKIDILVKQPAETCEAQTGDEIVVCAQETDNESQRLRPISKASIYDKDDSAAEFGLSENVRMAIQAESEELQQGVIAKRAMVKLKIKF